LVVDIPHLVKLKNVIYNLKTLNFISVKSAL